MEKGKLLVCSSLDHVKVVLKKPDPKQPIVIGRLLASRNPEPFVEWIKIHVTDIDGALWLYPTTTVIHCQ
jgi:hypothetical protein